MKIPHTLFLTVSAAAECVCVARNSTKNFNFLVDSVFLASSVTIFTAHCDSWTSRISEDGSVWALRMTQSRGRMWTAKIKHEEKQQQTTVAAAVAGYAKSRFFSNVSYTFSSFSRPSVNHSVTFFRAHYFFLYATSHTFTAPVVLLIVDRLKSIRIVCMQNVTVGGKVSCFCCVIFPLHLSTKKALLQRPKMRKTDSRWREFSSRAMHTQKAASSRARSLMWNWRINMWELWKNPRKVIQCQQSESASELKFSHNWMLIIFYPFL